MNVWMHKLSASCFTLSPLLTTIVPYANNLDQDETPSNSASHPDPSCLTLRQYFHQLWATLNHVENWSRREIKQTIIHLAGLRLKTHWFGSKFCRSHCWLTVSGWEDLLSDSFQAKVIAYCIRMVLGRPWRQTSFLKNFFFRRKCPNAHDVFKLKVSHSHTQYRATDKV